MATTKHSTAIPTEGKFIQYDRETRDYACYLDGQFLGYESTYSQAETLINNTYYEQLTHATSAAPAEPVAVAPEAIALADLPPTPFEVRVNGYGAARQFASRVPQIPCPCTTPIEVRHIWNDGKGDMSYDGGVSVAFTDYVLGDGGDQAIVSLPAAGQEGQATVILFGREEVPLDQAERALVNLLRLLADGRVQAHRKAA